MKLLRPLKPTFALPACTFLAMAVLSLLLLSVTGCQSTGEKDQRQNVSTKDFAGPSDTGLTQAGANQAGPSATSPDHGASTQPANTAASSPDTQPLANGDTVRIAPAPQPAGSDDNNNKDQPNPPAALTMDAMVGQVNGKAIYANTVFKPMEAQLTALGKTLPPSVFKQRATELIVGQLETIVTNALILGESERDLSVQEQYGLVEMLKAHREDLLRRFGEGSAAVADKNSLARTGKNVDEQVDDYRQRVLVGRYISKKISPKINVTRKDIERYYRNHTDKFNPPAGRTLRLIMTSSKPAADQIQKMLDSGATFDEAAKSPANQYRSDSGGLMPNRVTGDNFSGFEALNKAMVKLKAGEHSPMLKAGGSFWWVKVETYESGKVRSLEEVQLQVRHLLEDQQRDALGLEFRHKLMAEGSYNPINQMTQSLVNIAMARYSQVQ